MSENFIIERNVKTYDQKTRLVFTATATRLSFVRQITCVVRNSKMFRS